MSEVTAEIHTLCVSITTVQYANYLDNNFNKFTAAITIVNNAFNTIV